MTSLPLPLRRHADAVRALAYRWRLRLGDLGVAGLVGMLLGLALVAAGLRGIESDTAQIGRLTQRLREPPPAAPARAPTDGPHELLERLPPAAQRNIDIAALMQLSRQHGLIGARTQYRALDAGASPIDRLEVTLAATQDYESWRAFMVGVLNDLPHAAVTAASWSRTNVDSERIEGRLVIVLHHRRPS